MVIVVVLGSGGACRFVAVVHGCCGGFKNAMFVIDWKVFVAVALVVGMMKHFRGESFCWCKVCVCIPGWGELGGSG